MRPEHYKIMSAPMLRQFFVMLRGKQVIILNQNITGYMLLKLPQIIDRKIYYNEKLKNKQIAM